MSAPLAPARETLRGLVDGLAPVELSGARDLELRGELSELIVGDRPRLMRGLGQALVETVPLLVGSKFEVPHHDRGSSVGSRLPEGRSFVATP